MSERVLTCPSCKSRRVKVISTADNRTNELNISAELMCQECDHCWTGKITNYSAVHKRRIW